METVILPAVMTVSFFAVLLTDFSGPARPVRFSSTMSSERVRVGILTSSKFFKGPCLSFDH